MEVILLADEAQKKELATAEASGEARILFAEKPEDFLKFPGEAVFMDLLFEPGPERIALLQRLSGTVIIGAVAETLQALQLPFVRICAWPTLLSGPVVEACAWEENHKEIANAVMGLFQKEVQWLPDEPGFISARVICSIINEAYFALSEGVSSKEQIDTAMKLGTNYPYGPFEWASRLGVHRVAGLLQALAAKDARYQPCGLLLQELDMQP